MATSLEVRLVLYSCSPGPRRAKRRRRVTDSHRQPFIFAALYVQLHEEVLDTHLQTALLLNQVFLAKLPNEITRDLFCHGGSVWASATCLLTLSLSRASSVEVIVGIVRLNVFIGSVDETCSFLAGFVLLWQREACSTSRPSDLLLGADAMAGLLRSSVRSSAQAARLNSMRRRLLRAVSTVLLRWLGDAPTTVRGAMAHRLFR